MRVVIAGSGNLCRYMCDEFTAGGHDVVVLTRSQKTELDQPGVTQFVTDYSLPSLTKGLDGAKAVISTISDYEAGNVSPHANLLQACQQSPTCKRFAPSEFIGDMEAYPDQPGFYLRSRDPVRQLLRKQSEVEWTLIAIGWLADYMVPAKNRFIKDIGQECPIDMTNNAFVIPGTGREPINFTWARDIARAVVALVESPTPWEQYTFLSSEQLCWNDAAALVERNYPEKSFQTTRLSLHQIVEMVRTAKDDWQTLFLADHYLYSASMAAGLSQERVQAQRRKYFKDVKFRTVQQGLDELKQRPDVIV